MFDLSGIGGAIAAIAALLSFIVAHEAGHYFAAKATGMKVTEFFIGFGPRIWSFRRGETEYGIKPIPFGAYVKVVGMHGDEEVAPADEPRAYRNQPLWAKSVVVLSGVAMNFLIAFLIFVGLFLATGVPVTVDGEAVSSTTIDSVVPEFHGVPTAAAVAGLEPGDKIVAVDGIGIPDWETLTGVIGPLPGTRVEITVERDGQTRSIPVVLGERTDEITGEVTGFLGVSPMFLTRPVGIGEALRLAGVSVGGAVLMTFDAFGEMIRIENILVWVRGLAGAEVPLDNRPVSPVGIAQIGAQASTLGWENVVAMMAIVNIFLGTFNALPLFPLDGGHFLVAVIEKVIRRPINIRYLIPVAVSVIVLAASLGLLALALDIFHPIRL